MLWQPWQHYWDPASNVFWVISFTWTAGQSDLIIIINTPHLPSPHWWIFSHTDLTRILKYSLGHLVVHEITLPLSSGGKCLVVVDGGGILILWHCDIMICSSDEIEQREEILIGPHQVTVALSGVLLHWNILTSHSDHQHTRSSVSQVQEFYAKYFCLQMIICGPGINYQLLSRRCGGQPLNSQTSLVI